MQLLFFFFPLRFSFFFLASFTKRRSTQFNWLARHNEAYVVLENLLASREEKACADATKFTVAISKLTIQDWLKKTNQKDRPTEMYLLLFYLSVRSWVKYFTFLRNSAHDLCDRSFKLIWGGSFITLSLFQRICEFVVVVVFVVVTLGCCHFWYSVFEHFVAIPKYLSCAHGTGMLGNARKCALARSIIHMKYV